MLVQICLDSFDRHLHHQAPPTETTTVLAMEAMIRLAFEAGALWRDSFPDDEMHLHLS